MTLRWCERAITVVDREVARVFPVLSSERRLGRWLPISRNRSRGSLGSNRCAHVFPRTSRLCRPHDAPHETAAVETASEPIGSIVIGTRWRCSPAGVAAAPAAHRNRKSPPSLPGNGASRIGCGKASPADLLGSEYYRGLGKDSSGSIFHSYKPPPSLASFIPVGCNFLPPSSLKDLPRDANKRY